MDMNKKLMVIVGVVALAAVGWFMLFDSETTPLEESSVGATSGVVIDVDTTQAMVDGPVIIELAVDNGTRIIAIPSMGLPLCAARENIDDVWSLEVGAGIEVYGAVDPETGYIVPCESDEHYLRVTDSGLQMFESEPYGFSIGYGPEYIAVEPEGAVVIIYDKKEYAQLLASTEAREGPTSLLVESFPNPDQLSARAWVETNDRSNAQFGNGEIVDLTQNDKDGVVYSWSGLYEGESYAFSHKGQILVFSITYISSDDKLLNDARRFMQSLSFN